MDLLAHMATFCRVVETGSLSAAARAEGLSVPAVSRQLRALEQELGSTLIRRTTRRLAMTDAGQQWYQQSLRLLREVAAARASLAPAPGVSGRLVVSAPVSIGIAQVLPRVEALLRQHPGLSVDLRLEEHLVDLVADAVDVVVRAGVPPPELPSLVARPILRFARIAVASASYLERRRLPNAPSALVEHECLIQLGAAGTLDRWRFTRQSAGAHGTEEQVDVRGRFRASTPLALREACVAGSGVALLPEWLVADDLRRRRLRRLLPGWQSGPVSAWAVYRVEARGSAVIRAFLAAMAPP